MTKAEQRRRFEEMSRELGCDDGETLDRVFDSIVPPKPPTKSDNEQAEAKPPSNLVPGRG